MKCPNCNGLLEIFVCDKEEMYVCPQCLSVLVAVAASATLLKRFCDEALLQRFLTDLLADTNGRKVKAMVKAEARLSCPQCQSPMKLYDFNNRTAFFVNYCAHCDCLWITAGQIPLVVLSLMDDSPADRTYRQTLERLYQDMAPRQSRGSGSLDALLAPYVMVPLALAGLAIPVGDNALTKYTPWVTLGIIISCVGVFLLQWFKPSLMVSYTLVAEITGNISEWYRFLTHAFLHGGLLHLAVNMWFLWVFGRGVEDRVGRLFYLLLFLACAVGSGVLFVVTATGEALSSPCVGASGAISGVIGAYLILLPRVKIKLMIMINMLRIKWQVSVPAFLYIIGWIVMNLIWGLLQSGGTGTGVAYWGHVGGFITGIVFAEMVKTFKQR